MTKLAWVPVALVLAGCSMEVPGDTRKEQHSVDLDGSGIASVTFLNPLES